MNVNIHLLMDKFKRSVLDTFSCSGSLKHIELALKVNTCGLGRRSGYANTRANVWKKGLFASDLVFNRLCGRLKRNLPFLSSRHQEPSTLLLTPPPKRSSTVCWNLTPHRYTWCRLEWQVTSVHQHQVYTFAC